MLIRVCWDSLVQFGERIIVDQGRSGSATSMKIVSRVRTFCELK